MGSGVQEAERVVPAGVGAGPRHGAARRRAGKYGARRAAAPDGRTFASVAERDRYMHLLQRQDRGEISGLRCQPSWRFPINGKELRVGSRVTRYTADFDYILAGSGQQVVEDVKGFLTADARLRIALAEAIHGFTVTLVRKPYQ
jgi:hypothetical protein